MRISDWSSDVCSSDLQAVRAVPRNGRRRNAGRGVPGQAGVHAAVHELQRVGAMKPGLGIRDSGLDGARNESDFPIALPLFQIPNPQSRIPSSLRSEEHTSELQSLIRTSYAVFCLKKKT